MKSNQSTMFYQILNLIPIFPGFPRKKKISCCKSFPNILNLIYKIAIVFRYICDIKESTSLLTKQNNG